MAANKRTPDEIERDRAEVARRYIRGETQSEIATSLGVHQTQVSYDLRVVRQRWRAEQIKSFETSQAEQLAKLGAVEKEAWAAWDRSHQIKEITTHEEGSGGDKGSWEKVTTKREKLIGTPAFLAEIRAIVEARSRLLGLPGEIKYMDINAAIAAVTAAGYVISEPDGEDDQEDDTNPTQSSADSEV